MFDQKAYSREYYQRHQEELKAAVRQRYADQKSDPEFRERIRARREGLHFGVPREIVFRKTGGLCYFCGKPADVVHHLDEDGRNRERLGKEPGHNPTRLVPACRACHINIHRDVLLLTKKTRANGFWSRSADRCVECGRNDRKHSGHGLCVNCAARARRHRAGGV